MNVFTEFRRAVMAAVHTLSEQGVLAGELPLSAVAVEPPRDPSHGDLATHVAMVLGKPAKMAPRALAQALQPLLEAHPAVTAVGIGRATCRGSVCQSVLIPGCAGSLQNKTGKKRSNI